MTPNRRLGDYLRARREVLQPGDAGLAPTSGTRRVNGLRREEVAVLAGIGTDYYLRLEQGRDEHPSDQVLDALARALHLDPTATAYLHSLTHDAETSRITGQGDTVNPVTRDLIESWPLSAAIVQNRYLDILASNRLARALNPAFRPGVNSVLSLVLDPAERAFHGAEWRGLTGRSVSLLRAMADTRAGDERLEALAAQGCAESDLFREFWERREVRRVGTGVHVVEHPLVGELVLNYQGFGLLGDGQSIFVYFAQPGTPSAAAMERLAATT